jgi:hypothetical protein
MHHAVDPITKLASYQDEILTLYTSLIAAADAHSPSRKDWRRISHSEKAVYQAAKNLVDELTLCFPISGSVVEVFFSPKLRIFFEIMFKYENILGKHPAFSSLYERAQKIENALLSQSLDTLLPILRSLSERLSLKISNELRKLTYYILRFPYPALFGTRFAARIVTEAPILHAEINKALQTDPLFRPGLGDRARHLDRPSLSGHLFLMTVRASLIADLPLAKIQDHLRRFPALAAELYLHAHDEIGIIALLLKKRASFETFKIFFEACPFLVNQYLEHIGKDALSWANALEEPTKSYKTVQTFITALKTFCSAVSSPVFYSRDPADYPQQHLFLFSLQRAFETFFIKEVPVKYQGAYFNRRDLFTDFLTRITQAKEYLEASRRLSVSPVHFAPRISAVPRSVSPISSPAAAGSTRTHSSIWHTPLSVDTGATATPPGPFQAAGQRTSREHSPVTPNPRHPLSPSSTRTADDRLPPPTLFG